MFEIHWIDGNEIKWEYWNEIFLTAMFPEKRYIGRQLNTFLFLCSSLEKNGFEPLSQLLQHNTRPEPNQRWKNRMQTVQSFLLLFFVQWTLPSLYNRLFSLKSNWDLSLHTYHYVCTMISLMISWSINHQSIGIYNDFYSNFSCIICECWIVNMLNLVLFFNSTQ